MSPVSGQQPVQPRRHLGDDLRGFTSRLLVPGAGYVCQRPVQLVYGANPLAAPAAPGVLRDSGTAASETVVAVGVQAQHPAAQHPAEQEPAAFNLCTSRLGDVKALRVIQLVNVVYQESGQMKETMPSAGISPDFDVRDLADGVGLLAATANVIMQLARPEVGYGVVESKVDSAQIMRHPVREPGQKGTT